MKENQKFSKNLFSATLRKTLNEHSNSVYALAKLKNGDLISGSSDTVKIWNATDWTVKQTLHGHAEWLRDIIVLDNKKIINASDDFSITVLNLNDGTSEKTLKGHNNGIRALVLLKNGDLASASSDNTIIIWNIKLGKLKNKLSGHTNGVWSLVVLDNGDLASASLETITIWDLALS